MCFKRLLDVVVSLWLIALLFPVMVFLAILIVVDMHEWPFYSELRPGRNQKLFLILKLKSMKSDPGLPDRDRLTRLGAFLRKYSLDELPQLWNVLWGSMSLVGPRPLKKDYLPYYTSTEQIRHSVRPGITGMAQISGRNYLSWNERLRLDVVYVRHLSFLLDLNILHRTLLVVFKAENVSVLPEENETDLDAERK